MLRIVVSVIMMQAEDLGDPESILICLYVELNDPKMTQEEFYISLQTLF